MDPVLVGYLGAGFLFVFLAIGIPVGVAMGFIGICGMLLGAGELFTWGQLKVLPFWVVNNYAFAVLPMFVLMGILAESSGITRDVFYSSNLWLRRFRGGLYQAVIVGSAIFAAISGSTIVNAVVFTRIAFPQMLKFGYSKSLSIGAIAGSGSFAAMIPTFYHDGNLCHHYGAIGRAIADCGRNSGIDDSGGLSGRCLWTGSHPSFIGA